MKFNNIKHVYFDLDHTLWDFDKNSALTFDVIFKEENIGLEIQDFLDTYIPINIDYWARYRNNLVSKEVLRVGRLHDSFKAMKIQVSDEVIDNLSNRYISVLPGFNHLLQDTIEILDYLKPQYKLHIITNGFEEIQHNKMQNSKIADFFETITTSEEAGVKKPHFQIFNIALQKANATPENSIMIGDSYEADIEGAKNAGLQAVFFDYYGKNESRQVPQIQKLNELRKYL
ncbi:MULTISPECIES: YjjG family noncanonical pyrimidine nucleotidase [Gillisia]|jgi:putative hydrolase of the HAD superfamily|uniref:Noncanonical pyrimidine nucleotidase, YjjG family n=1 Tax=Gillisia hiemivivida TaxID=291190 RepID=A0A5C6ZW22_9FLAO|nr:MULTISPECIES: YjjG family noncanonical pyrimidine nucleotidase [Gillisia]TXD93101.1 noncanonical pyrimidine nucleotidase, YjjG family [Gillisia hiemivivida]